MNGTVPLKIRQFYRYVFRWATPIFVKERINTNIFSFSCFVLSLIFCMLVLADNFIQASFVAFLIVFCDVLALLVDEQIIDKDQRHKVIGSIVDKFWELIFYTGIVVVLIQNQKELYATFVYITMIGSIMSSFIKEKMEQLGMEKVDNFVGRQEGILLMVVGLLAGQTVLAFIAFLSALLFIYTVSLLLWRIWFRK